MFLKLMKAGLVLFIYASDAGFRATFPVGYISQICTLLNYFNRRGVDDEFSSLPELIRIDSM